MRPPIMLFGKHRGERLERLSDAYLRWVAGLPLKQPLRRWVAAEIRRRQGEQSPAGVRSDTPGVELPFDGEQRT